MLTKVAVVREYCNRDIIRRSFMKKWIALTLFCSAVLSGFFFSKKPPLKYPYQLAICAIFKNETPWMKEWLEYHRLIGVDHFYLYNNDSTDHYAELLDPYVKEGIVELIEWCSCDAHKIMDNTGTAHEPYQTAAYNECLKKRALGKAKWVAVVDIDEFIVPVSGLKSFHQLLDKMAKKGVGSLKMHWKIFGTSNVWNLNSDELLIEKLTHRAPNDLEQNKHVKSIHRPEAVEFCYIHHAKLNKGFKKKRLDPETFRIHHYWTRTAKCCAEKRNLTQDNAPDFLNLLNRLEDKTIFQYLPKLKEVLTRD